MVGCGYWGPNLIRNFSALPDCNLKQICDKDAGRLQHLAGLYPKVEGTQDFEHMLNGSNLDAVVVATPVRFHHPMAKAALEAGKHVFIEKPMAMSTAECDDLNEIAQRNGLVIMVGHTFLYSSPVRRIKQIIDDGDIGKIQYISSRRLNLGLFQKDINVVWDLAPHDLSIILYLMGQTPKSVNCQGRANVTPGIEDVSMLSLQFEHGYATVQSSWLEPKKVREMTIVGDRRMIVYDDCEPQQKIRIYDTRVERPPHYDTFAEFQYAYHYGDMIAPHVAQTEPLKIECQHFLDCIREGVNPISCGRQGRELVRILEASTQSLRDGGGCIHLTEAAPTRRARIVEVQEAVGAGSGNGNGNGNGNGKSRGKLLGARRRVPARLAV